MLCTRPRCRWATPLPGPAPRNASPACASAITRVRLAGTRSVRGPGIDTTRRGHVRPRGSPAVAGPVTRCRWNIHQRHRPGTARGSPRTDLRQQLAFRFLPSGAVARPSTCRSCASSCRIGWRCRRKRRRCMRRSRVGMPRRDVPASAAACAGGCAVGPDAKPPGGRLMLSARRADRGHRCLVLISRTKRCSPCEVVRSRNGSGKRRDGAGRYRSECPASS